MNFKFKINLIYSEDKVFEKGKTYKIDDVKLAERLSKTDYVEYEKFELNSFIGKADKKEEKKKEEKEDLNNLSVKELQEKCKEIGLKGYSNLTKDELILLVEQNG